MSAIQVNKQKKKFEKKKKLKKKNLIVDVFLPFAIVRLKFVVLMIKTTFIGHFLCNTLTHSQTHSLTDSQSHRKVFLQSCIAAAKNHFFGTFSA